MDTVHKRIVLMSQKATAWDKLTRKIERINASKEFDRYDDPEEMRIKAHYEAVEQALFVTRKVRKGGFTNSVTGRRFKK